MPENKKPINDIKDDLQSVIFSIEKLHNDMNELREINKDILNKLTEYLSFVNVEKTSKKAGWFF